MTGSPCVISVAEHAGWAHIVCVAAHGSVPAVAHRRRITLIDAGLPTQPYHHDSLRMTEDAANALIAQVRRSVAARTLESLQSLVNELAPSHAAIAVAIRQPPFPALPDSVATAWGTQRLYSADGMLYQLAVCDAARRLGVELCVYPRGEEMLWAARQLRTSPRALERFIGHTGRPSGPPWQQEHRRAYAAGIVALAESVRGLTIPGE